MKYILCPRCSDLLFLTRRMVRTCECGNAAGFYNRDGDTVTISDGSRLYGLSNQVFYTGRAESWRYDESNGKVTRLPDAKMVAKRFAGAR